MCSVNVKLEKNLLIRIYNSNNTSMFSCSLIKNFAFSDIYNNFSRYNLSVTEMYTILAITIYQDEVKIHSKKKN